MYDFRIKNYLLKKKKLLKNDKVINIFELNRVAVGRMNLELVVTIKGLLTISEIILKWLNRIKWRVKEIQDWSFSFQPLSMEIKEIQGIWKWKITNLGPFEAFLFPTRFVKISFRVTILNLLVNQVLLIFDLFSNIVSLVYKKSLCQKRAHDLSSSFLRH